MKSSRLQPRWRHLLAGRPALHPGFWGTHAPCGNYMWSTQILSPEATSVGPSDSPSHVICKPFSFYVLYIPRALRTTGSTSWPRADWHLGACFPTCKRRAITVRIFSRCSRRIQSWDFVGFRARMPGFQFWPCHSSSTAWGRSRRSVPRFPHL